MVNFVVAATKPWFVDEFNRSLSGRGNWHLVTSKDELNLGLLHRLRPKYIFFPHWNWKVPTDITDNYECICFHMTDVPYGRGGSPLQNLIVRGHSETMLSALRMVEELDAGPVYKKVPLRLNGSAQDIFYRLVPLVFELMDEIAKKEPIPIQQEGEVVEFQRRKPSDSEIRADMAFDLLYDHIRMLDADTYPRAFIGFDDFKIEFSSVARHDGELTANVRIIKRGAIE